MVAALSLLAGRTVLAIKLQWHAMLTFHRTSYEIVMLTYIIRLDFEIIFYILFIFVLMLHVSINNFQSCLNVFLFS